MTDPAPAAKLTKAQIATTYRDMGLLELAGAALADGFDPIEVFKHCGHRAFEPAAEQIGEIRRKDCERHDSEDGSELEGA